MFNIFNTFFWLKNNFKKKDIFLIGIIILIYFLTRLINIEKLPIFTDEGIYIHWAKVAWHDASWRFVSLTDGRQPLQTWATIPFLKLFPNNALLAGRLFGVLSGFVALSGMFMFLYYLFGKLAAYLGAFFYLFTPYFLFYDRMALMDSGVNAAFIWILFLSIVLAKTLRLDIALIFGIITGLSLLTKSSTKLFAALAALSPLIFLEKNLKKNLSRIVNFYILFTIAFLISLAIYNIQRLSPFLHYVTEKNKTFIYTLGEILNNPLSGFKSNFYLVPYYVLAESGFFLPIIGALGWLLLLKNNQKLGLYLSCWIIIPYLTIAFFARVLYPRYLIFFASMFVIFICYLLVNLFVKRKTVILITLILFFISVAYFNYTILFNWQNIPLPPIDRGQYIEGSSSGYGIKEIVEFVRKKSIKKPSIIIAEGNFGMAGDVLDVFVKRNEKIFIKSYWPLNLENILENQKELDKNQVFVVFVYRQDFPKNWPLKFINKFDKVGGKSSIYLFELVK